MTIAAEKACDYFWAPFKKDCEELLGRFQLTESVRYEEFSAIWRAMDFSSVFHGIFTRQEKRAFSRLVFASVYDYFLPPYSFQIRAGALYMLYGLYHTQVTLPKEKIWISLKDWGHVQKFVSEALSCQHLDVVYVYRKLESDKVFFYTAMPKQLMFDGKRRFLNKDINEEFQDRSARVAGLVNEDTVEEIATIQGHYERIKQGLSVSSSISVTAINLSAKLKECALEFQQWQEKNAAARNKVSRAKAKKSTQETESSLRADLLSSIKAKSYGQPPEASKSRRHRQIKMETSDSGTDHVQEFTASRKRQPSLRARTWQNLGKKDLKVYGDSGSVKTQHWLLTSREVDKNGMKRKQQRSRFKW